MYLLSCNVGEIVLLPRAVIAGLPLPLKAGRFSTSTWRPMDCRPWRSPSIRRRTT
jgi:hypothetical protein